MKCRSRSTLGIVVGWLGVIASILIIIGAIVFIANKDKIQEKIKDTNNIYQNEQNRQMRKLIMEHGTSIGIFFIVLCMVSICISVLLIQGIQKKRHVLMTPWLVLSAISFVIDCLNTLLLLIAGLFFHFIVKALFLGLEGFIIYKIYTLYRDMKTKNNERNGRILTPSGVGFTVANSGQLNAYSSVPQKA